MTSDSRWEATLAELSRCAGMPHLLLKIGLLFLKILFVPKKKNVPPLNCSYKSCVRVSCDMNSVKCALTNNWLYLRWVASLHRGTTSSLYRGIKIEHLTSLSKHNQLKWHIFIFAQKIGWILYSVLYNECWSQFSLYY